MEMLSEPASIRPTPATRRSKSARGGATGGSWLSRRGCVRTMETVASSSTTRAAEGRTMCFMDSVALFDVSDSSVVHVGNGIGEVKDAVVVHHHDNGAVGMHR